MGLAFYKIHILRGTTTRQKAERANGFKSAKYFPFLLRYNSNMWPCDNGIGIVIAITFPMAWDMTAAKLKSLSYYLRFISLSVCF